MKNAQLEKALEHQVERLAQLQAEGASKRVKARVYKKVGQLKAQLAGEELRSKKIQGPNNWTKKRKSYESEEPGADKTQNLHPAERRKARREGKDDQETEKKAEATILCGGCPWDVDDDAIRKMFEAHGAVMKAQVARNRKGLSRGIAFIEMECAKAAVAAVEAINGTQLEGRELAVKIVPSKDEMAAQGGPAWKKSRTEPAPEDEEPPEAKKKESAESLEEEDAVDVPIKKKKVAKSKVVSF